jgi:hypothetical protein
MRFSARAGLAAERRPDDRLNSSPQARPGRADSDLLHEDRDLGDRLGGTPGRTGETSPDLYRLPVGDRIAGSAFHFCQVIGAVQDHRYERLIVRGHHRAGTSEQGVVHEGSLQLSWPVSPARRAGHGPCGYQPRAGRLPAAISWLQRLAGFRHLRDPARHIGNVTRTPRQSPAAEPWTAGSRARPRPDMSPPGLSCPAADILQR